MPNLFQIDLWCLCRPTLQKYAMRPNAQNARTVSLTPTLELRYARIRYVLKTHANRMRCVNQRWLSNAPIRLALQFPGVFNYVPPWQVRMPMRSAVSETGMLNATPLSSLTPNCLGGSQSNGSSWANSSSRGGVGSPTIWLQSVAASVPNERRCASLVTSRAHN